MASINKTTTNTGQTRYRVRYRDPSGDSRERWFRRRVDADRFARNVEVDIDRGEWIDPSAGSITVSDWSATWLATKSDRKPKTLEGYSSLLEHHILPNFGARTIGSIRSEDVAIWLSELKAAGLSASRVRQAFGVLNGMLRMAVGLNRLSQNPAGVDAVRKMVPRPSQTEMRFLTLDQLMALSERVPDWYRPLVLLLGTSGLRWGEAAALRRKRVHLLERRIHVAESVSQVHGHLRFGSTKSGKDRWVDIPGFVAQELGVHLGRTDPGADSLVFTTPTGEPLRNSNFRRRIWAPALVDAGLPADVRVHDLRHSAASMWISKGAPITLVQRQLGHASVVTTQRYTHLYPSEGADVAARIDESYRSACGAGVGLGSKRSQQASGVLTRITL